MTTNSPSWQIDASISLESLQTNPLHLSIDAINDWEFEALVPEASGNGLFICDHAAATDPKKANLSMGRVLVNSGEPGRLTHLETGSLNDILVDTTLQSVLNRTNASGDDKLGTAVNIYLLESIGFGPVSQIALALYLLDHHYRISNNPIPVFFPVGSRFVAEISKTRALRHALSHLAGIHGIADHHQTLHAITSRMDLGANNQDNNLVRSTLHATAAVLGSADILSIQPWNVLSEGYADDEARRLSLNISRILRSEAHLDRVRDACSGSFSVENATEAYAQSAWTRFLKIKDIPTADLAAHPSVGKWLTRDRADVRSRSLVDNDGLQGPHIDGLTSFSFPSWEDNN